MTRSRELAKILTDGNLTGTLDVTGDLTIVGSSTFDDIKLTGVSLPAAGNPSIALRDTNNIVYHQSGSGNSIVLLDASQNTMYNVSSSSHIFNTGNSERMRINSSGKVGIGDSSPLGNKVHIRTGGSASSVNATAGLVLEDDDSTRCDLQFIGPDGTFQSILFGDVSDDDIGKIAYSHTGNSMRFTVNASERMRIDGSGNVGIGLTSSATKLHIRSATASNIAGYRDGTTGLIVEGDTSSFIQMVANKQAPMGILFDGGNGHNDTARGSVIYDIDYGLAFKSGGYTRWKIDEAGDIIPYSTSSGIVLGSTSNVASNTLDDYEEGTWTPTLVSSGATFQYSVRQAEYTKVGDVVHFNMYIQLDGGGNSFTSNIVTLEGWPFTSRSGSGALSRHFIHGRYLNVSGSGYTYAFLGLNNNAAVANLVEGGDNVPLANLNSNNLSNASGQIVCSGIYFTDA